MTLFISLSKLIFCVVIAHSFPFLPLLRTSLFTSDYHYITLSHSLAMNTIGYIIHTIPHSPHTWTHTTPTHIHTTHHTHTHTTHHTHTYHIPHTHTHHTPHTTHHTSHTHTHITTHTSQHTGTNRSKRYKGSKGIKRDERKYTSKFSCTFTGGWGRSM